VPRQLLCHCLRRFRSLRAILRKQAVNKAL